MARDRYSLDGRESFEFVNFCSTLKAMSGVEVIEHPFDRILEVGQKKFNQELLDLVLKEKPDLFFAFMYTDELDPEVLGEIKTKTKSIAWFADDYWRFWNYSRHWAPFFSRAVTTSPQALEWYEKYGHKNIIKSEWACNTKLYQPVSVEPDIDVSFVGQRKPPRAKIINQLKKSGIRVEAFGSGWPNGKISHEKMIEIFSRSKINLNLNPRPSLLSPRVLARIFLKKSINQLKFDLHLLDNLRAYWHFQIPHTHARPFELAGCGAFVLSGYSKGIENYYREDKEMVFYRSNADLAHKIKYYLANESERSNIARAGYERTIKEHTYEKRFYDLFQALGLEYNV